ncbi:glycosyltransferase family 39 protein [bacterium]|nr:glycosyltransferase family 39 protein [bacterium]
MQTTQRPSGFSVLLWVLCLSALAVGAKNFEQGGIGVDGPHYAVVAREMARSGDWFFMRGTIPDYQPAADYPHLGIWLIASVFSVLPAADWTARIPGILFYVGFLLVFFRLLRLIDGPRLAVAGTLALWVMYRFSNFFSNVYLDPGMVFFGMASLLLAYEGVKAQSPLRLLIAGCCLALSFMMKGMAAAGFVPAIGFTLLWGAPGRNARHAFWNVTCFVLGFATVLGLYLLAVEARVPGLLEKYWSRQWTNRFSQQRDWSRLWEWRYWGGLLRDCHYFLLLGAVGCLWKWPRRMGLVPWIAIASFSALYAPIDRVGNQYWLALLPWIAWVFASVFVGRREWKPEPWMLVSGVAAVVLLFFVQFTPVRVHGPEAPDVAHLQRRMAQGIYQRLVLDSAPQPADFTRKDHYYWYGDTPIVTLERNDPALRPDPAALYLLHNHTENRAKELKALGWCLDELFPESRSFWRACPLGT